MTPVLMAVSDDGELLARRELELGKRYGADHEIVCEASADTADAAILGCQRKGRRGGCPRGSVDLGGERPGVAGAGG